MQLKNKLFALGLVVCVLACAAVLAAQERGSVRGVIKDADGNVVEGANGVHHRGPHPARAGIRDQEGRRLSLPGRAARDLHGPHHPSADDGLHRRGPGHRRPPDDRERVPVACRPRFRGGHRPGRLPGHRPEVDRGLGQLAEGPRREAAHRPVLRLSLPAGAGRRRQPRLRPERRRQQAGQRLPLRRVEHHQPAASATWAPTSPRWTSRRSTSSGAASAPSSAGPPAW